MSSPLCAETEKCFDEGERHIHRLPEDVIRRIAAGEVIQRPSSALKELIENALDAGSTSIQISLQDGGLKRLDISDNGCGISKADLPFVCYRFTTSKLNAVKDLERLQTFGFRGEALASISLVAHVTIQSKIHAAPIGYTCDYRNTEPIEDSFLPSPCKKGTHITYEDLFYALPARRRILRNAHEEYNRCLEIIQCYAIAYPTVSFSCKKYGSTQTDLYTVGYPSLPPPKPAFVCASPLVNFDKNHETVESTEELNNKKLAEGENIQRKIEEHNMQGGDKPEQEFTDDESRTKLEVCEAVKEVRNFDTHENSMDLTVLQYSRALLARLYGKEVANNALEFSLRKTWIFMPFEACGLVSSSYASFKKTSFILFINGRLVQSSQLRRALLAIYEEFLPRGGRPWIYLSLHFSSDKIDVNVHPTKHEIKFLYEQDVINCLCSALRDLLKSTKTSNTYKVGDVSLHPSTSGFASTEDRENDEKRQTLAEEKKVALFAKTYLDPTRVRVDVRQSRFNTEGKIIFPLFVSQNLMHKEKFEKKVFSNDEKERNKMVLSAAPQSVSAVVSQSSGRRECVPLPIHTLTPDPVERLLALIAYRGDKVLSKQVTESVYVGAITPCMVLLQHQNKLLAVHLPKLVEECTYQFILSHVGELPFFFLENQENASQLSLYKNLEEALHLSKSGFDGFGNYTMRSINEMARYLEQQLIEVSLFLKKHFSLLIENGYLKSVPGCCGNYFPGCGYLSMFLLRLATQVEWKDVLLQFDSVARILANFFVKFPLSNKNYETTALNKQDSSETSLKNATEEVLLNYLYPVIHLNTHFAVPKRFWSDRLIIEVTNLETVYKLFERC